MTLEHRALCDTDSLSSSNRSHLVRRVGVLPPTASLAAATATIWLEEIAVSDRATLRGLTQFSPRSVSARPQAAECKSDPGTVRFEGGFCATLFEAAPQIVDSKRRDVGVVDRARLESDFGEAHRVIPKHLFAQSVQRLPAAESFSM